MSRETEGLCVKDVERVRNCVQIGDRIRIHTQKTNLLGDKTSNKVNIKRIGTVIAKYPRFALLRLENGVIDTMMWVDLLERRMSCD